jgi:type VII secretion-associated serine protease mycosin
MPHLILALLLNVALLGGQVAAPEPPNDPEFPQQWALGRVGAQCAWSYTQGSPDVTVAVVDTGVDLGHPDLVGRLRADGYDFVDGDAEPRDENGHGTNVAGIVAAVAGNGEGVAGLAPAVAILPVRVMDARGNGRESKIAEGIRYAADHGAHVINLSVGASLLLSDDVASRPVGEAIAYAGERGALIVVAAGNDFAPAPNAISADAPNVLVVAASDQQDRKAPFSNFGPWIDVVAPGVGILSTMPTYEVYLTRAELPADRRFRQGYDYMSGTSQAAPYVSALAALLFARHPDWGAEQVAAQIRASAVDIASANPELDAAGSLGGGRIDACAALGVGTPPVPVAAASSRPDPQPASLPFSLALAAAAAAAVLGALAVAVWRVGALEPPLANALQPSLAVPSGSASCLAAPRAAIGTTLRVLPRRHVWGLLRIVEGPGLGRVYLLSGAELRVGRAVECEIVLVGDPAVSRVHLRLRRAHSIHADDLGSTHGSYHNSRRISGPVVLREGDTLRLGATLLRLELRGERR